MQVNNRNKVKYWESQGHWSLMISLTFNWMQLMSTDTLHLFCLQQVNIITKKVKNANSL